MMALISRFFAKRFHLPVHRQNRRITSKIPNYFKYYSTHSVPQSAQVIICGAGAVGNSVAYHMLKNDWNDIIVLEQSKYVVL